MVDRLKWASCMSYCSIDINGNSTETLLFTAYLKLTENEFEFAVHVTLLGFLFSGKLVVSSVPRDDCSTSKKFSCIA